MRLELIEWTDPRAPTEPVLRQRLEAEGFAVWGWQDGPDATYAPHTHDHHESLWVVGGRIVFGVAGREYALGPGDRLMLPRGTVHTAQVGPEGAAYLVGQLKG